MAQQQQPSQQPSKSNKNQRPPEADHKSEASWNDEKSRDVKGGAGEDSSRKADANLRDDKRNDKHDDKDAPRTFNDDDDTNEDAKTMGQV